MDDHRQWPNVKVFDLEIAKITRQLRSLDINDREYSFLLQKKAELVSKRYDQIQFNKIAFEKDVSE